MASIAPLRDLPRALLPRRRLLSPFLKNELMVHAICVGTASVVYFGQVLL